MKKYLITILLGLLRFSVCEAQDPDFSQFFISQQLLNPASAGSGFGDWRLMMNYRHMWGNTSTPYNTTVANLDYKLNRKTKSKNILASGLSVLTDQSMYGALKSIYASAAVAYHVQLDEQNRLGLGLQGNYGTRRINQSLLTYGEQFTSGGFNTGLPSGELFLFNATSFLSVGSGLWYNYNNKDINIDLGAAAFHLNKPKQSIQNDISQYIPIRYVVHANVEYEMTSRYLFSFNSVFMQQSDKNMFSVGGALAYDLEDGGRNYILYAGGWYRVGVAVYPYLGLLYQNIQLGVTYDINVSKQVTASQNPNSFEISLVFKQSKPERGAIPCPWK